jgi:hypothetical protein
MNKLMRIDPADNVFVVRSTIYPGDTEELEGIAITFEKLLAFGYKIAAENITKGAKIIKFGVPIGSALEDIPIGTHIHLHNMKSDYISTYTLEHEFIKSE